MVAVEGDASATVTFVAPASNGGATITGYTVTSIPSGGTDAGAGTTSLTHSITGLANGTAYTFTVTATNLAGTSVASTASASVTPATVPDPPTNQGGGGGSIFGRPACTDGTCFGTANNTTKTNTPPSTTTSSVITPTVIFSDIHNHWARNYINKLVQKCGVQGYKDSSGKLLDKFGPDDKITRAQLVKIVVGCKQKDVNVPKDYVFSDVAPGQWFAPYIVVAKKAGWVKGYKNNVFKPAQDINRVEALKIILIADYGNVKITGGTSNFHDVSNGQWYSKYVNFAVLKNIVNGYFNTDGDPTGFFGPANLLTRAEAAKMIINAGGY